MREIKFRQALFVNGKFAYFHYWGFLSAGHFASPETNSATIEGAWKNSMQFTGLLDKNGKEIYEGDICKVSYVCPVCYENDPHVLIGDIARDATSGTWMFDYGHGAMPVYHVNNDEENDIETIGNIYENPDLLK
jgi:hypothetical protein